MEKVALQAILTSVITIWLHSFQRSEAFKASKWDQCSCYWSTWRSWSDCTSTCFGDRERYRPVEFTRDRGCTEAEDCAYTGGWEFELCNQRCNNGGSLHYDSCSCKDGYYGDCCDNRVSCGTPDDIAHGSRSWTSTDYGGSATYSCNTDYRMTRGSTYRYCRLRSGSSGEWSGRKPYCAYMRHCSSWPCKNGATCTNIPDDFRCSCKTGWSGRYCQNDIQPPVMSGCPSNLKVNATKNPQSVQWTEPSFSDPMGTLIKVVKNYNSPNFTFPWDDFTVQYVATKLGNGLQTECRFTISVRPTPCKKLNVPVNGALVCNGWRRDLFLFCLVACKSGYTIDREKHSYEMMYACGASGRWIAQYPAPDCNIQMADVADIETGQPSYSNFSYTTSCTDPTDRRALQTTFIDTINRRYSFRESCTKFRSQCIPENVLVEC